MGADAHDPGAARGHTTTRGREPDGAAPTRDAASTPAGPAAGARRSSSSDETVDVGVSQWQRLLLPAAVLAQSDGRRTPRDWVVDALMYAFSIAFGVVILMSTVKYRSDVMLGLDALCGLVAFVALWVRRRRPTEVAVLVVVLSAFSALAAAAALAACFNAALRMRVRPLLGVTAFALVGVAVSAAAYGNPHGYDWSGLLVGLLLTTVAVTWGLFARAQRDLVAALHERATRLENERRLYEERARDAERRRIAREMHDVLAHRLSLLSVHAGALEFRPDAPPDEIATAAGVVRSAAHAALQELREVIGVLREPDVEPPRAAGEPSTGAGEDRGAAGPSGSRPKRRRAGASSSAGERSGVESSSGAVRRAAAEPGAGSRANGGAEPSGGAVGDVGGGGESSGGGAGATGGGAGSSHGLGRAAGGGGESSVGEVRATGRGAESSGGAGSGVGSAVDREPRPDGVVVGGVDGMASVGSADGTRWWAGPGERVTDPPQPTLAEIPALVEESREAGAKVALVVDVPNGHDMPPALGRTAYRIVQEGLTNARKHAPAAAVEVDVVGREGEVVVSVVSRKRVGAVVTPRGGVVPGTGVGLIGLAERVALAGGALEHGPAPTGDFVLRATLPWSGVA